MQVEANWRKGISFAVKTESGHSFITDGSPQVGGANEGARPMELVLSAAATCCGIDITNILNRGKHPFTGLSINVTGERVDDVPAVFSAINVSCKISGAEFKFAERAVKLSVEKYCSVLVMLASVAKITWDVGVTPAK